MKNKVVIIFIIITFGLSPIILARYYERIGKIDLYMQIAEPIIQIEKQNTIVKKNHSQNKIEEFYFEIRNYNENKVSEIEFLYDIEIKNSNENFPIEYQIYDLNTKEIIKENNENFQYKLEKNIKTSHKYKIIILWNRIGNYNGSTDIDIIINAKQNIEK